MNLYNMARNYSTRKHRGGSAPNPSSYSSGATYGMAVNGSGNSQYDRVFEHSGDVHSNTIIGLQGQKAGRRSRVRRGGIWGQVINQAIVPFGILAAQQTYRKRKGGRKSRKAKKGGKSSRRR